MHWYDARPGNGKCVLARAEGVETHRVEPTSDEKLDGKVPIVWAGC